MADVLELCDLNYAEAMRELCRRAGGTVLDEGGVLLFAGTHPLPALVNGVVRMDPHVPAAEVLERAAAFFSARGRGYSVLVRAHCDTDLRRFVEERGLTAFGNSPGMVLDRRLPDASPPPGVRLRRVSNGADTAAFADVMGKAYASLGMPPDVAPAILCWPEILIAPHIVSFLALLEDGTPAGGAMTIVTHGVAGVYWVGTIPEARGRGLAEFCTRVAGNAGFDLGARIAALQASVMGEPVYRRMGYVEVTRYPYFVVFAGGS